MKTDIEMSVYEVVGNSVCVASSDGQKVFDRLAAAFKQDRSVNLSFHHVTMLTSAFLNAAIGQLYGVFNEEKIRLLLSVDMQYDDLVLLKRVVDTAKLYFNDPKRFDQAVRQALEDDNDDSNNTKY